MESPLRILFVLHLPWSRHLGGSRIHFELAEALSAQGHSVDHLSADEVVVRRLPGRLGALVARPFADQAVARLREIADGYDVIDGLEGCIPASPGELGFDGLLVCRSLGLGLHYREFLEEAERRWPADRGRRLARPLRRREATRRAAREDRSLTSADLVMVPNHDEEATLRRGGLAQRVAVLPYGLTDARRDAFRQVAVARGSGPAPPRVAFTGYWQSRKGRYDWPELIRRITAADPSVAFRLLGTGRGEAAISQEIAAPDAEVAVVPEFTSEQLPGLLADCTVAAFPSYMEGFGFAVLEQLAAGLPVVAYDAPGPREMLRGLPPSLLVEPGDVAAMAAEILRIVHLPQAEYGELSALCQDVGMSYRWADIAQATAEAYRSADPGAGHV